MLMCHSQDVVLSLIKERMNKAREEGGKAGFLIDGYPRERDQGIQFEKDVRTFSHLSLVKFKELHKSFFLGLSS